MIDLTLKELKENIYEKTNEYLTGLGYKGNKNKVEFVKKGKSATVEVGFGFNSFTTKYEFSFAIMITYPELKKLVADFYRSTSSNEPAKWNIGMFEGQFRKELENEDMKRKKSFNNVVKSKNELDVKVENSLRILKNKALPLLESLEDIEKFAKVVCSNFDFLKTNITDREFFVSALLIFKITGEDYFDSISKKLETFLVNEVKNGSNYILHFFYLEQIRLYHPTHLQNLKKE